MKKALLFFGLFLTLFAGAQIDTIHRFESEQPPVVVMYDIPDSIKNDAASDHLNIQAYQNPGQILSFDKRAKFSYKNFFLKKETIHSTIYSPGKNQRNIVKKGVVSGATSTVAWVTMLYVFCYFSFFSFFIKKKEKGDGGVALRILALGAALAALVAAEGAPGAPVEAVVAPAAPAALVVALVAAAVVLAAAAEAARFIHSTWVGVNIIGLVIITYFFTPLFLVSGVGGMIIAELFYRLLRSNDQSSEIELVDQTT
jgi:hypothetical protein